MAASLMKATMAAAPMLEQRGPAEVVEYLVADGILRDAAVAEAVRRLFAAPDVRTVEAWARRCGLSRRTLGRWMQGAGLPSPIHWTQLVQLVRVIRLMQRTGCTAGRAAYSVGYPDPFTMSNQMQRALGMRPSDARLLPDVRSVVNLWLHREHEAGRLASPEARSMPTTSCPVCGQTMRAR